MKTIYSVGKDEAEISLEMHEASTYVSDVEQVRQVCEA